MARGVQAPDVGANARRDEPPLSVAAEGATPSSDGGHRGYGCSDPAGSLPASVQELLRDHARSLEHVELLVFLRRSAPQSWTASRLAGELPWPAWVDGALEDLCAAGLLVTREDGSTRWFAYGPATADLEAVATRLDEVYSEHRADVIRMLNELALERLRSSVSRAFSSALGRGR